MLYLFNSAIRPLYTRNVLNTLFLPVGCTNEYRYRYTGQPCHVPPALFATLPQLKKGLECAIVFIDRFNNGGYVYHPIRLGKYESYRVENERVFFKVRLGDFIYPRDVQASSRALFDALGPSGIPRLQGADPANMDDGYYAISNDTVFGVAQNFHSGGFAWDGAVEELSTKQAFQTTADETPLFLKFDLRKRGKKDSLTPKSKTGGVFELDKDAHYDAVFTYRFPRQRTNVNARAQFRVVHGENLRLLGSEVVNIEGVENSIELPIVSKKYADDAAGTISVQPLRETGQPALITPEKAVEYHLSPSFFLKSQMVFAVLALAVASTLLGLDWGKIAPATPIAIAQALWPKVLLGFLNTGLLFWLFWLVGKKVL
jgi:hypothetical protein